MIDILEQKEVTAQAYIKTAARYNIPLEAFGDKIPIQPLGGLPEQEQFKTIRSQIKEYLEEENETLDWEKLYNRLPDKKLRLAICLEILKDKVLDTENPDNFPLNDKTLEEAWDLLKEQRISDLILKEWISSMVKFHTKGPWSNALDDTIINSIEPSLTDKKGLIYNTVKILEKTSQWVKENRETLERRLEIIKSKHPDFDPNSDKWQKILVANLRQNNINIQVQDKTNLEDEMLPEKRPTMLIVGERHGASNNSTYLYNLLKDSKDAGFTCLTLEEPRSSGWAAYIEFAQTLSKTLNHKPKSIEEKAIEFCNNRGITERSTAQKLTLIHIGRVLGYETSFVDIDEKEKKEMTRKRKEKNEKAIIGSDPVDPENPITALGGPKTFANSIIEAYKDCLHRSKEMAKPILEVLERGKVIHVGGILHCLDLQHEICKNIGKLPTILVLEPKKVENSISKELGKYPQHDPQRGIHKLNLDLKYDDQIVNQILTGQHRTQVSKPKRETHQEQGLLLN